MVIENDVDCSSIPSRRALHSYQPAIVNWTSSMMKPSLGSNDHELEDEDTSIWTGRDETIQNIDPFNTKANKKKLKKIQSCRGGGD